MNQGRTTARLLTSGPSAAWSSRCWSWPCRTETRGARSEVCLRQEPGRAYIVLYDITPCCIVLHCVVLYCILLYSTVACCIKDLLHVMSCHAIAYHMIPGQSSLGLLETISRAHGAPGIIRADSLAGVLGLLCQLWAAGLAIPQSLHRTNQNSSQSEASFR